MKLILHGICIKRPQESELAPCVDAEMKKSGKWEAKTRRIASIEEALAAEAPFREKFSCKRYHMVFNILPEKP